MRWLCSGTQLGTAGSRNDLKICQSCLVAVQRHSAERAAAQEHEARWFFQQLIVGLDYCHKMVRLRLFSRGSCRTNRAAPFALSAAYGLCNLPSSGIRLSWDPPVYECVNAPERIRLSFGVVFHKRKTWVPCVTSTVGDAQGVVNRDIKLENTLLDQSRRPLIKICDFGYSKHLQKDSVPKSRVGTPGYTGCSHLCASQGSAIQATSLVSSDPEHLMLYRAMCTGYFRAELFMQTAWEYLCMSNMLCLQPQSFVCTASAGAELTCRACNPRSARDHLQPAHRGCNQN